MSKSIFLFIALGLGVNFWELIVLDKVFNDVTCPVLAVVWALYGLYNFRNNHSINLKKYNKYFYWLAIGFSLSVVSAYVYWNQDILTGIIVNRGLIFYIYLPVLLYIKPSENDIVKALTYYTFGYFIVWTMQALTPYPIISSIASAIELGRGRFERSDYDFGYLLRGYTPIAFLLYYKTQKLIENFDFRRILQVFVILVLIFMLQNRGILFFAVIVFTYSMFKIKTFYRFILIPILVSFLFIVYFYSAEHWTALYQETLQQLNDPYYNRWKSFYFFLFNYSPHWMCNVFGNGFLSANVPAGRFIQELMDQGFYQYDNGILGFWSQYGIIPIIVLYSVIFKLLFQSQFPFYTKAIAAHILFIPIAWDFHNVDIMVFVILIYLLAYYREIDRELVLNDYQEQYQSQEQRVSSEL